jgi:hypothetical protein
MHRPGGYSQSPSADARQVAPASCRPLAGNPCLGHAHPVESAQAHLTIVATNLFSVARRSRNQTLPLLHRMEERAGERRGHAPLLGPLPTPASWGEEEEQRGKSSQPATISTDTDRLQACATGAASTLNTYRRGRRREPEAGALPVTPSARVATRVCAATATFP